VQGEESRVKRPNIPVNERIIFALDCPTADEAKDWVKRLEGEIRFFKVGLELFSACGPDIVHWILLRGCQVMLDLKLFDIPRTVMRAVQQFKGTGIRFLTVHGLESCLRAALEARPDFAILAVTVLTSLSGEDLKELGLGKEESVADLVSRKAKTAVSLGCGGVVCSPMEVERLRSELGWNFWVVTPGIRPGSMKEAVRDEDQARVAGPGPAIAAGADYIVVGRPIREAMDPVAAVQAMKQEISKSLCGELDKP